MTKVLKQNGSGGKIIRAQGSGKVLKQNYNFGNILKTGNSELGYYYKIRDLSLANELSFLLHVLKTFNNSDVAPLEMFAQNGKTQYFMYRQSNPLNTGPGAYSLGSYGTLNAAGSANNLTQAPYEMTYAILFDIPNQYCMGSGGLFIGAQNLYSKIDLLLADGFDYFRFPRNYNSNVGLKGYGDLLIYDRLISELEIQHYRNNGIGNDPLSTGGLIARFDFRAFEIINNEYIGFRNLIQDKYHIELINAPVGTLEEQVNFANINLIGKW